MPGMNPKDDEEQDLLETLVVLVGRQTRLLEEIRDLLAEQGQRTASTRSRPGEIDTRSQLTIGEPQTSMRRNPGSGSSSL